MIQAIIFDCFGVLTSDGWLPFKAKYFGHDPDLMQEVTSLNRQADAGLLSYSDFVAAVAEKAGVSIHAAKAEIENNVPNEPLFAYITELKRTYKIAMLSNAADNWLDDMFAPNHLALFDVLALSCESGFVKPQSEAYQGVADRLGVPAESCVMIDDQERYCTGARDAGMQAIWYQNVEQTKTELSHLLADTKG